MKLRAETKENAALERRVRTGRRLEEKHLGKPVTYASTSGTKNSRDRIKDLMRQQGIPPKLPRCLQDLPRAALKQMAFPTTTPQTTREALADRGQGTGKSGTRDGVYTPGAHLLAILLGLEDGEQVDHAAAPGKQILAEEVVAFLLLSHVPRKGDERGREEGRKPRDRITAPSGLVGRMDRPKAGRSRPEDLWGQEFPTHLVSVSAPGLDANRPPRFRYRRSGQHGRHVALEPPSTGPAGPEATSTCNSSLVWLVRSPRAWIERQVIDSEEQRERPISFGRAGVEDLVFGITVSSKLLKAGAVR